MKRKKVLVAGSTGMIGRAMLKRLAAHFDAEGLQRQDGFDITDPSSLEKYPGGFDVLLNCAAGFRADDAASMIANESVNSLGALNLCRFARERGCGFVVYLSTISAIETAENPCRNSYSVSKKHGEDNVELFCREHGMKHATLRLPQVYDSEGRAEAHQKMLYHLVDAVRKGEAVQVFGKHDPVRNYMHLDDVVEIVFRVIEAEVCGVYNCAHTKSHTLLDAIRVIAGARGVEPQFTMRTEKPDIRDLFVPKDTALFEAIGYYPRISLSQGIKQIFEHRA